VPEPAPAEAPPGETVDQAAPPAKSMRSRKRKAEPNAEPEALPAANNDTAAADDEIGEPRRSGWWQRTFG
jgi:ribonuclease E